MAKKKAGRPKIENPMGGVIRIRVLPEVVKAIEDYRKMYALINQSEAIRHAIQAELRRAKLL